MRKFQYLSAMIGAAVILTGLTWSSAQTSTGSSVTFKTVADEQTEPDEAEVKTDSDAESGEKYLLRYQFQPGETMRWNVTHQGRNKVSAGGITRDIESVTTSVKSWQMLDRDADGNIRFKHQVDDIVMRQTVDGKTQNYNSKEDGTEDVPPIFKNVAETVGKALFIITLDDRGKMLNREVLEEQAYQEGDGMITLVMPEDPIGIGDSWTYPEEVTVRLSTGAVKKVKTQKKYTLKQVKTGIATIQVAEQVLTPVRDPEMEAQLIQKYSNGTIRFDIDAGRVLGQQTDLDKTVIGAGGGTSSVQYRTRFTEEYAGSTPSTDSNTSTATVPSTATTAH